jgi:putative endonuclease
LCVSQELRTGFEDAPDILSVMAGHLPPDPSPGAAIHAPLGVSAMRGGWVYIMTNRPNGTLYVGVTGDLVRRAWEHREGNIQGFTKRYGLKRLVYLERHDDIAKAIQREKNLKHWPRAWKVALILRDNPTWNDLYEALI